VLHDWQPGCHHKLPPLYTVLLHIELHIKVKSVLLIDAGRLARACKWPSVLHHAYMYCLDTSNALKDPSGCAFDLLEDEIEVRGILLLE
jgi:hypothetical protein